jgi:photosystem II stability/assembly factor-like uncharacterized protein
MSNQEKKLILTSVNQLITLAKNNPALAAAVPKLAQISQMELSTAPKKSCNCGGKRNITTPDVNKQVTENLLSSLGPTDFNSVKSVLGLSQLCYYRRNASSNALEQVCV